MPLGDHLRAHENIRFSVAEAPQKIVIGGFGGGRIGVHTHHLGFGQQGRKLLLQPLRTITHAGQVGGAAIGENFVIFAD